MKNKFVLSILIILFFKTNLYSNELDINSNNIKVFKNSQEVKFSGNVQAKDINNNILKTIEAIYQKDKQLLKTLADTEITTSNKYQIFGSTIFFDNINKKIYSENPAKVLDIDGNTINVQNFQYSIKNNMFFSKGQLINL